MTDRLPLAWMRADPCKSGAPSPVAETDVGHRRGVLVSGDPPAIGYLFGYVFPSELAWLPLRDGPPYCKASGTGVQTNKPDGVPKIWKVRPFWRAGTFHLSKKRCI
jgi:hypothetical protein